MAVLEQLIERSTAMDAEKTDYSGKEFAFRFAPDMTLQSRQIGSLTVLPGLKLTDWALDQVCTKLGPLAYPTGSSRKLPKELVGGWMQTFPEELSVLLNAHIAKSRTPWFVRTWRSEVRAVLSTQYAPLNNTEVLETVGQALYAMGKSSDMLNFVRPEVSEDRMGIKILLAEVDTHTDGEQPFGIGFYLGNDEVGKGMLRCNSLIQRHSCLNSIIFAESEGNLAAYHRGLSDFLKDRLALAIAHIMKISGDNLRRFLNARTIHIPSFEKAVLEWAADEQWDTSFTAGVLEGSEGHLSLFGLVNGLTYAAHTTLKDAEKQHEVEAMAGALLVDHSGLFKKLRIPA